MRPRESQLTRGELIIIKVDDGLWNIASWQMKILRIEDHAADRRFIPEMIEGVPQAAFELARVEQLGDAIAGHTS